MHITSGLYSPWGTAPAAVSRPILGALVERPAVYRRNDVGYISVRSWRADAKAADMLALKAAKQQTDEALIGEAAAEISITVRRLLGADSFTVTAIPCGHSRRSDCFGKRLAQQVAAELGLSFVELFEDRFCNGVSHPKEFAKLPPLAWRTAPPGPMLVVDDVATSGWHLEEALTAIRAHSVPALGVAWISGTVTA